MGAGFVEVKTTSLGGCFWMRDLAAGGFCEDSAFSRGREAGPPRAAVAWTLEMERKRSNQLKIGQMLHTQGFEGLAFLLPVSQFTSCWSSGCQGA